MSRLKTSFVFFRGGTRAETIPRVTRVTRIQKNPQIMCLEESSLCRCSALSFWQNLILPSVTCPWNNIVFNQSDLKNKFIYVDPGTHLTQQNHDVHHSAQLPLVLTEKAESAPITRQDRSVTFVYLLLFAVELLCCEISFTDLIPVFIILCTHSLIIHHVYLMFLYTESSFLFISH